MADRGHAQTGHYRVLRHVDDFVDFAGIDVYSVCGIASAALELAEAAAA